MERCSFLCVIITFYERIVLPKNNLAIHMARSSTYTAMYLLIPNRDSPNGYSTVMPAELQSVTFVTLSRPHKTLTTHKLACSCFAAIFGYQ